MVRIVPLMAGKGRLDLQFIPFRQRIPLQPVFRACAMTSHRTFSQPLQQLILSILIIRSPSAFSLQTAEQASVLPISCFPRLRPCNAASPLALRCLSFGSAVSQICPPGFGSAQYLAFAAPFPAPGGLHNTAGLLGAAGCVPLPAYDHRRPSNRCL